MTPDKKTARDAPAEAVVRKRKGIQTVWIIPIVAALVGGWLWFKAMQEKGPEISITWVSADGLEAGKTKVKYKDLEIGQVLDIRLDPSLENVIVTAELHPGSKPYLVENTRFWVVKPRIGAGGVSGLSTIVSGAYIAADLSTSGAPVEEFAGLEEPPTRPADAPGLRIKLRSETLGSISTGTPVSHRRIPMGDVEGYRFLREEEAIEFDVFILPEYADLIRRNTRFWNASGFDVELSAEGFRFDADSLESILVGGIAFGKAPAEPPGPRARDGEVFTLLGSRGEAEEINSEPRRTIAYFTESIRGVTIGTPVEFQGIEIGKVLKVGVEADSQTLTFRMPIIMETYPQRITTAGEDPNETHGERMERMVAAGLRAQLGPANLLTGARTIVVDFHPETEAVFRGEDSGLPEMPTIPSTGEAINAMVAQLPEIVADLRATVDSVATLATSDETADTLASLKSATESLDEVLARLADESGPLLASLQGAVDDVGALAEDLGAVVDDVKAESPEIMTKLRETADATLGLVQGGEASMDAVTAGLPAVEHELTTALREIASGMRSLATLADYLERHPEALLKGKGDQGGL